VAFSSGEPVAYATGSSTIGSKSAAPPRLAPIACSGFDAPGQRVLPCASHNPRSASFQMHLADRRAPALAGVSEAGLAVFDADRVAMTETTT
jgi:hypothetical protein